MHHAVLFQVALWLKVVAIIDCFEIFIENPSNLSDRACTWSQYKNYNITNLISETPQVVVSFISNGWEGQASDEHIAENSGFLNKLATP